MRFIVTLLCVLMLPLPTLAAVDTSNSSDYPGVDRIPGSYIVQYKNTTTSYRLVLGGLEKINGVLAPEKEQRLSGELFQITYRIPERYSAQEAFSLIGTQITAMGGDVLFNCVGRDCGSSNQWANNIFKYSRLYGVDSTQSFSSYQLGERFFSLYAVKRGNKRVYMRLEVLETPLSSTSKAASSTFKQLLSPNRLLPLTDFSSEFGEIIEYLNINQNRHLWIVGHDDKEGSIEQQIDRAVDAAAMLRVKLIENGIEAERVHIHSLGRFTDRQGSGLFVYVE